MLMVVSNYHRVGRVCPRSSCQEKAQIEKHGLSVVDEERMSIRNGEQGSPMATAALSALPP